MLADIIIRMGSYALRGGVEKSFLKGRYGRQTASEILKNRSLGHTVASIVIAKFATRSLPGAALVSTGIAAKVLYDRGKSRHEARAEGDADLLKQVE